MSQYISRLMGWTAAASKREEVERQWAAYLQDAQDKAASLFVQIERQLIRLGVSEKTMSKEIYELAKQEFGVQNHWHKQVVRSGPHTLKPYKENTPDRNLEMNEILFVDLGPVFEDWEADFGRTFVIGHDPLKIKLRDSLGPVWKPVKARFDEKVDMTGEELYEIAREQARRAGYDFGQHAGHLVGDFPHERIPKDKVTLYITPGNNQKMRSVGKDGHQRHWILEIHLIDRKENIGGFFEQLLTVG